MAFSHTLTHKLSPSGPELQNANTYSGSGEDNRSEEIATGQTDKLVVVAIDVSAVKSFYMVSDVAVTVETNSGSAADDTIALKAGVPYVWNTDSYDAFLLGTDVTALYITNASGSTSHFELRCISDATP